MIRTLSLISSFLFIFTFHNLMAADEVSVAQLDAAVVKAIQGNSTFKDAVRLAKEANAPSLYFIADGASAFTLRVRQNILDGGKTTLPTAITDFLPAHAFFFFYDGPTTQHQRDQFFASLHNYNGWQGFIWGGATPERFHGPMDTTVDTAAIDLFAAMEGKPCLKDLRNLRLPRGFDEVEIFKADDTPSFAELIAKGQVALRPFVGEDAYLTWSRRVHLVGQMMQLGVDFVDASARQEALAAFSATHLNKIARLHPRQELWKLSEQIRDIFIGAKDALAALELARSLGMLDFIEQVRAESFKLGRRPYPTYLSDSLHACKSYWAQMTGSSVQEAKVRGQELAQLLFSPMNWLDLQKELWQGILEAEHRESIKAGGPALLDCNFVLGESKLQ
ncbi:MAG: hypothetical protein WCG27_00190 [Pseudomonadota bacterium]